MMLIILIDGLSGLRGSTMNSIVAVAIVSLIIVISSIGFLSKAEYCESINICLLIQGDHILPSQYFEPPGYSDLATAL